MLMQLKVESLVVSLLLAENANLGIAEEMCDELTDKHAIFLTKDGRISIAGLNSGNIATVAKAIHAVTDGKKLGA